jgi:hypothetical protein
MKVSSRKMMPSCPISKKVNPKWIDNHFQLTKSKLQKITGIVMDQAITIPVDPNNYWLW